MKKTINSIINILIAGILIAQPAFAATPDDDVLDMFNTNNIFYYNPNGSDDLCGSSATKLAGDTIEEKIWNFYIDQGFSDVQVAGILGNAKAETGVEPTRASNSSYWGLFQWYLGYVPKLVEQINSAGLGKYFDSEWWPAGKSKDIPADDLDQLLSIQLNYTIDHADFDWITEVKKQTTVEAAAEAFLAIFERAVGGNSPILYYEPYKGLLYQGTSARRDFAKEFYEQYSGKGTSASKNLSGTENGKNLTVFGDSITVASSAAILEKFPDLTQDDIYAKSGRRWDEAVQIAKSVSKIKDNVIFALGANSPNLKDSDIEDAINAV